MLTAIRQSLPYPRGTLLYKDQERSKAGIYTTTTLKPLSRDTESKTIAELQNCSNAVRASVAREMRSPRAPIFPEHDYNRKKSLACWLSKFRCKGTLFEKVRLPYQSVNGLRKENPVRRGSLF